ncbi:MAG: hypothetical protein QM589_10535 [Thermomicrobiales bacterium]
MRPLLLQPDAAFDQQPQPLCANTDDMSSDLELPLLFNAMAAGDAFLYDVAMKVILAAPPDPEVIRYRQAILTDCRNHPNIILDIYRVALDALEVQRQHYFGFIRESPDATLGGSIHLLEAYIPLLRHLRQIAEQSAGVMQSKGLRQLFATLQTELDDAYLDQIAGHVRNLDSRRGVLLEASVGRVASQIDYKLLRPVNSGWRDLVPSVLGHDSYSFQIAPRDDAGNQSLDSMRSRGILRVANASAQSADHVRAFFTALWTELAFYLGCLNLRNTLEALSLPTCLPEMTGSGQEILSATCRYDVSLALQLGTNGRVVGNDVAADGKSLVMITGANQGGKSTFLRSVGLAQLMGQCGMYVAATSFRANIAAGVFTHYKREEDATMTVGKFEEEVRRMSAIVDDIVPGSILLCNESFLSTNEREGSEIGRQVVWAMIEAGVKVIYVTHLYDLAHGFEVQHRDDVLLLRAERREGGERSFKVLELPPLSTSFGRDLYARIFGVDDVNDTAA